MKDKAVAEQKKRKEMEYNEYLIANQPESMDQQF